MGYFKTEEINCENFIKLPLEIGKFTYIHDLVLFNCNINEIPENVKNIENLQFLTIRDSNMQRIPNGFGYFHGNDLVINFIRTNISDFGKEILQAKEIRINNNKALKLPANMVALQKVKKLYITESNISNITENISSLYNIEHLTIINCKVNNLSKNICKLQKLKILELYNNNIKTLPAEIWDIPKLEVLSLHDNNIQNLPNGISKRKNTLRILRLSNNKISNFPIEISELYNLEILTLINNPIKEIPKEILYLKKLKVLNLENTGIEKIPDVSCNLLELEGLILKDNKIDLFPKFVLKLKELKLLDLNNTGISSIPDELCELKNLQELCLADNNIVKLPDKIDQLVNLDLLDIRNNKIFSIYKLPKGIVSQPESRKTLLINGNPINFPPLGIVKQGTNAIASFIRNTVDMRRYRISGWLGDREFDDISLYPSEKDNERDFEFRNEVKLLIVGDKNVGKTHLSCCFRNIEYKKPKVDTYGIDIHHDFCIPTPDNKEKINFYIWDFAGEVIKQGLSQFFISHWSVFILLWTKDNEKNIEIWLNNIVNLSKDCSIIIVLNKIDLLNETERNAIEINMKYLKKKFPQIKNRLHKISCTENEGVENLIKEIAKVSWKLPLMKTFWSVAWLEIRNKIKEKVKSSTMLKKSEYLNICENNNLSKIEADILLEYFCYLGICLHFKDNNNLKSIIFLNPEWVSKVFFKIIISEQVNNNEGVLKISSLSNILSDILDTNNYTNEYFLYNVIPDLLYEFRLGFPMENHNNYLVVACLAENNKKIDYKWNNDKEDLIFEYHYNFLPNGLITKFIVKIYRLLIKKNGDYLCWQKGCYIKYNNEKAYIKQVENVIKIRISGTNKSELLAIIQNYFNLIHKIFNDIKPKEMLPCVCGEHRFELSYLKERQKIEDSVICEKTKENVSINRIFKQQVMNKNKNYIEKNNIVLNLRGENSDIKIESINIGTNIHIARQNSYKSENKQKDYNYQLFENKEVLKEKWGVQLVDITELSNTEKVNNDKFKPEKDQIENMIGTFNWERLKKIAASDREVFIYGESGSGKEGVAKFLHNINNNRRNNKFIPVNCATLIQGDLFEQFIQGRERGALGGINDNEIIGAFELADNGTIFFDEIGEIRLDSQGALLRVLEEKEIARIGAPGKVKKFNFRFISATNKNVWRMKQDGLISDAFFRRIMKKVIYIPPLRDRLQDIPLLRDHFLDTYSFNDLKDDLKTKLNNRLEKFISNNCPENISGLKDIVDDFKEEYLIEYDFDIDSITNLTNTEKAIYNIISAKISNERVDVKKRIYAIFMKFRNNSFMKEDIKTLFNNKDINPAKRYIERMKLLGIIKEDLSNPDYFLFF